MTFLLWSISSSCTAETGMRICFLHESKRKQANSRKPVLASLQRLTHYCELHPLKAVAISGDFSVGTFLISAVPHKCAKATVNIYRVSLRVACMRKCRNKLLTPVYLKLQTCTTAKVSAMTLPWRMLYICFVHVLHMLNKTHTIEHALQQCHGKKKLNQDVDDSTSYIIIHNSWVQYLSGLGCTSTYSSLPSLKYPGAAMSGTKKKITFSSI